MGGEEDNIKAILNSNISDFADTPHVGHPDLWMFPPLKVDLRNRNSENFNALSFLNNASNILMLQHTWTLSSSNADPPTSL